MSSISVADERFLQLVPIDVIVETLLEGFEFTEGPVWHPIAQHLTFSDIPASRIWRWSGAAPPVVVRAPSSKTNGLTYDRAGRLLMCEHASAMVTRLEPEGNVTELASQYRGQRLNSPNDIVCTSNGTVFFTDPTYGCEPHLGTERVPEMAVQGVYRLDPNGSLARIADDFTQPNGLCLSVDEGRLYVNDSEELHIRVFDLDDALEASGGGVWAVTEDRAAAGWAPDGMKVDAADNVWCTGTGGLLVLAPDGTLLGKLHTAEHPANFCFGGPGLDELYITAHRSVYRAQVSIPGIALL